MAAKSDVSMVDVWPHQEGLHSNCFLAPRDIALSSSHITFYNLRLYSHKRKSLTRLPGAFGLEAEFSDDVLLFSR